MGVRANGEKRGTDTAAAKAHCCAAGRLTLRFGLQADLYEWKEVLNRLHQALAGALAMCPHLVLVGVKTEVRGAARHRTITTDA